jgi:hypothetical protein
MGLVAENVEVHSLASPLAVTCILVAERLTAEFLRDVARGPRP